MPKVDLFLMQDIPYPNCIEMAQLAEAHGCENLWLIDGQDVFPDPWTTAALCAVNTSRIRIGPGVTNPLTRHPRVTANAMLTVHDLSDGRGILGLGTGDNAIRTLGWKPATISQMRQTVAICRERFRQHGADIPIYIAAGGPKMTAYACEAGDGIIVPGAATPQDLRRALHRVAAAATLAGRDLTRFPILYYLGFAISHHRQEALDDARGGIARRVMNFLGKPENYPPELDHLRHEVERAAEVYNYNDHLKSHVPHTRVVSDTLVEEAGIAGTPQDVLSKFNILWQETAGYNVTFFLRPDGKGKQRSFELFIREVLPELS